MHCAVLWVHDCLIILTAHWDATTKHQNLFSALYREEGVISNSQSLHKEAALFIIFTKKKVLWHTKQEHREFRWYFTDTMLRIEGCPDLNAAVSSWPALSPVCVTSPLLLWCSFDKSEKITMSVVSVVFRFAGPVMKEKWAKRSRVSVCEKGLRRR